MGNGCISVTVFIDLKKALDTVDHAILSHKLEHYGLQMNELLWSNSYLFLILTNIVELEAMTLILATLTSVFHKGPT